MHLVHSIILVALVTPLALAGPRGNGFFKRTGDDDTNKDLSSTLSPTSTETLSTTSSATLVSVDSSFAVPKDQSSTIAASSTSNKDKDAPSSITTTSDKDKSTSTTSALGEDTPTSGSSTSDEDDKKTSSGPAKDQITSSSVPSGKFSSATSVTLPYVTGLYSAPESTQEIVLTDVVYTTLTTCPVTNTVTSGSSEIVKVTTTISTITLTSTSTLCTKCVAPPTSKPEAPSPSVGTTKTKSFLASVIYSLTELSSHPPSQASASTDSKIPNSSAAPPFTFSVTLPKAPLTTAPAKSTSSPPEISLLGTAVSSSTGLIIPNLISSTVLATSYTGSLVISGYSIVSPPTSVPEGPGPLSNASSTIIPVFSAPLLGNAYGGGFVATPTVYAFKLASPSGPPKGYAPGYGFSSKPEISATNGEIPSSPIFTVPGPVETSPSSFPTSIAIPVLPTISAVGVPVSVSVESSTPAFGNVLTSEAAIIVSSVLANGPPISLASTVPLSKGQIAVAAQISSTVLTPVVGVNGLTSLAVGFPSVNPSNTPIPSISGLTSILGASGLSSIIVVPSPVVGQNGLTSLAIFSTPIAANGLTSPAVVLTPVVGANGLTSLAVLATPVVGANGLTSLAIGFASEQAIATTLLEGTSSPNLEYALIGDIAASPGNSLLATPSVLPGSSIFPSSSGGNASVHVSLHPTAIAEFEGAAKKMTLSCAAGLVGFIIFLLLL